MKDLHPTNPFPDMPFKAKLIVEMPGISRGTILSIDNYKRLSQVNK
jgi:hypothetical protein